MSKKTTAAKPADTTGEAKPAVVAETQNPQPVAAEVAPAGDVPAGAQGDEATPAAAAAEAASDSPEPTDTGADDAPAEAAATEQARPNADDLAAAGAAGGYTPKKFTVMNKTSTPHVFPSLTNLQLLPGHRVTVEIASPFQLEALCIDIDAVCGIEGAHKELYEIEPVEDEADSEADE